MTVKARKHSDHNLQDADTEAAPLFGRGDHTAEEEALTVRDHTDLIIRATFLITLRPTC